MHYQHHCKVVEVNSACSDAAQCYPVGAFKGECVPSFRDLIIVALFATNSSGLHPFVAQCHIR
jgi:hypothetical protein